MPPLEVTGLDQKAVLWVAGGFDRDGNPTVAEVGLQIDVFFEECQKSTIDPHGNMVTIDGYAVVDRKIPIDSIMALGTLDELGMIGTGTANRVQETDLLRVVNYKGFNDDKGRSIQHSVAVVKFRDTLPGYSTEN